MLNIVLFGPPGSGKGTQAEKMVGKFDLVHLSTGDILRNEIAAKTQLGLEAKETMDKGELVPDHVVIGMIGNKIKQAPETSGFIFDGFPRTTDQAVALDELLQQSGEDVSCMIALQVEKDELVQRLLKRGVETGRSDDNIETIEHRIEVYEEQTAPAIDYYDKQNKYKPVNGQGDINIVFNRIEKVLEAIDPNK